VKYGTSTDLLNRAEMRPRPALVRVSSLWERFRAPPTAMEPLYPERVDITKNGVSAQPPWQAVAELLHLTPSL